MSESDKDLGTLFLIASAQTQVCKFLKIIDNSVYRDPSVKKKPLG